MKVKGKIKDEKVIVLIDYGATHNFISEKLIHSLNLPTRDTSNYGVIIGLGAATKGKGICGKVELMVRDWKISDSFLPIELGGADGILGMQWLQSLGMNEVDQKNLIMIFQHKGRKAGIKEDPSLPKGRVSVEKLPPHEATWENWDDFAQQFLDFHLEDKVILEEECKVRNTDTEGQINMKEKRRGSLHWYKSQDQKPL
ncbi:ty3-gypsy retroelement transposase [Cucumis melo var. makuwa]|uniref:Ty3-gypsy retroelement transposase n=1 Tax=Cucumis melo var. makuwa TaxID=1194695 RepID=A0A5A7SVZ0_CUCMM|nr:ty3-gypsy retroelement transposase [Cucumis melo var. makuwa]